jgi:hypothetical protein
MNDPGNVIKLEISPAALLNISFKKHWNQNLALLASLKIPLSNSSWSRKAYAAWDRNRELKGEKNNKT